MQEEIKENIVKCSRCGLCMDVCPVYKAKQTETAGLRGKFLQLLGLIRGELKYDKKINYNLDLCLSCNKCKKACPSDVDAVRIFSTVKSEFNSPYKKFLASYPFFKLKIYALKTLYRLKYPLGKRRIKKQKTEKNIAYFRGCAQKAINAGFKLPFKKAGFDCCGIPFYTKGRFDIYNKLQKKNIKLIKKFDKVVFDCATCFDFVSNYNELDDLAKNKLIYFTDFFKTKKLFSPKKIKLTFHKPCHLSEEKFLEIEKILSNIENISYERIPDYSDCCGFGGDFFTHHIKTASFLSLKKINDVEKTGATLVLTTCPTCLWSLKYGIKARKMKLKAFDLADFLYNFIEIKD